MGALSEAARLAVQLQYAAAADYWRREARAYSRDGMPVMAMKCVRNEELVRRAMRAEALDPAPGGVPL